jgi:capsular polysaccharide biosynthesis protein
VLLDTESGTPNRIKQMPAIHRHRLRLSGPVLTLVRTPRSSGHYYHFIAERFRFVLHALRTCPELRSATIVVRPEPSAYQRAAYDYLVRTYPGLTIREVPADVRVVCEELVCVGRRDAHKVSHFAGHDDFEEIAHAYRTIYGIEPSVPRRRLYLSRAGVRLRRTVNEAEIEALLAARGFETVRPETLSHADQVRLFGEARTIVSTGGAALTNLLFVPPGGTVIETVPREIQFPFFIGLALQMGLGYGPVYGGPPGPHEAYRLDPAALAATLDALGA